MRRSVAPLLLGIALLAVAVTVGLVTGSGRDFLIVCGAAVGIVVVTVLEVMLTWDITEYPSWRSPYGLGWPTRERYERVRRMGETGKVELPPRPDPRGRRKFMRSALPWLWAAAPCGVAGLGYAAVVAIV